MESLARAERLRELQARDAERAAAVGQDDESLLAEIRPAADRALNEGLGAGWRTAVDAEMAARLRRRLPFARILLAPFLFRRRDVERTANISYGDAGRKNLLDVYRHRSRPSGGPVLVHLHG